MSSVIIEILISVVPSTLVGMGAAYLTAHRTLATYGVRLDRLEGMVQDMDKRERIDAERLTRLEAKLDVLIMRMEHRQ